MSRIVMVISTGNYSYQILSVYLKLRYVDVDMTFLLPFHFVLLLAMKRLTTPVPLLFTDDLSSNSA
jgi:hypothetical protein